ncbi:uncharacterized protein PHACADRAFT_203599 [Phanerochaete carnosa HHB-10118-sp]|uniref:UvrD-like helicase ATP-binding domain-containing protein n=1 Tax=Phanerochaete carnosa (strain HHB-10118-sp) TaxID=650164 RepID=K5XBQ0_PHACS|nr:uncharacterized protein PHACADRAFT_203599 [Phanerochaete carnosa HHB-10118-sp]EKM60387.1 hypothetical protein PHACADRAFT_203599 [Phanerochaete carnosa HHB-10118-sp]
MSQKSLQSFGAYLKDQCPGDSTPNFLQSLPLQILLRFEFYLASCIPVPFEDLGDQVRKHSTSVKQKLAALRALEPYCELGPLETITSLSSRMFVECGERVPRTGQEAKKLGERLVRDLMFILKSYLNILSDGRLSEAIAKHQLSLLASDSGPSGTTAVETPEDIVLLDLSISRKKASMTLDTIDRFGPVRITVSTRFIDNMRTSRRRPRLFAKIKSTVMDLAQGEMQGQNGMILARSDEGNEIYSAFLNKYCSMVYYCPEADEIRIFGIYTTGHLENQKFWAAAAKELLVLQHSGETSGSLAVKSPAIEPELADQIRFLVVLDRFIELSKPIMQRIQDDKEIQAMFELSPQEEEVIEHEGSCYVLGRSGTGKTTIMLFKMINVELAWYQYGGDVALKPRQLFVTRSQHLADRVRESFSRLHETHVLGARSTGPAHSTSSIGTDRMSPAWTSEIPDSFDELKVEHFPLFISYDKLCTMLETALGLATYSSSSRTGFLALNATPLTYEIFLKQYWEVYPKDPRLNFDPFLVYGEIIGVIKGSEETLASGRRFLERAAYLGLGRGYSTFEGHREELYLIFQWYSRRQGQLKHVDIADRTHAILEALREQKPSFLRSLDFVYVDEAQDNLLIDALVMRLLSKNSDGFLWAGDTAQTIFAGNSFTFSTLKSFLYRVEEKEPVVYRARHKPAFFKLTTNFRSCGGIVACGQTILDIIASFWPSTLDQIPKEVNLSCGTRPYFFSGEEGSQIQLRELLSDSNKQLEFGAQQCILVRNDDVRDSLRPHLGDSTLLLTLYESKGLEFNDVLLWNFFEDSSYDRSDWVTITRDGLPPRGLRGPPKGLTIELKFLYVATTRAKNRLWILDNSAQAKVIQNMWAAQGEIEMGTDNLDLSRFAAASGPEEWARKGRDFFREARYKLAAQAWRVAGLHHDAAVANAFYLRDQVEVTSMTGSQRAKALRGAADAFLLVAAEEPVKPRQDEYYVEGAGCLLRIPDTPKAAFTYLQGCEYTRAVRLFRSVAMFDEAVKVIRQHCVDSTAVVQVIYVAKLYYFQQLRLIDAIALHSSHQEALDFLDDHGLRQTKGKVVVHLSLHTQAAELHLRANRLIECLKHYRIAKESASAPLCFDTDVLLGCLWREPAFSIMLRAKHAADTQASERLSSLWELVKLWSAAQGVDEPSCVQDEISMFKAISCGNANLLEHHSNSFITSSNRNRAAALLCLRHALHLAPVPDKDSSAVEVWGWLRLNSKFVSIIRSILLDPGYLEHRDIRRLAGFRSVSPREVRLVPQSLALSLISQARHVPLARDGPQVIKKADLFPAIAGYLRELLLSAVDKVRTACQNMLSLHDIGGGDKPERPTGLRLVLQSILVEDSLRGFEPVERQTARESSWLETLYNVFIRNSPAPIPSAMKAIREAPEGQICIQIFTGWIRNVLKDIQRIEGEQKLTVLVQLATLSTILDPEGIVAHMGRVRLMGLNAPSGWLLVYPPHARLRDKTAQFVLNDLLDATEGIQPWSLHSGVQFLRHFVKTKIVIDANTLCDFIDYLLGRFAVALCGAQGEMAVPSNGALLVLQNLDRLTDQETDSISALLDVLGDIMRRVLMPKQNVTIRSGAEPLKKHQQYGIIIRICQSMGILGSTVDSHSLRQEIVATMARLRSRDIRIDYPPALRFALAEGWSQVASEISSVPIGRLIPNVLDSGEVHYTLTFGRLSQRYKQKQKDADASIRNAKDDGVPFVEVTTPATIEFATLCAIDERFVFLEPLVRRILCARLADVMACELPGYDEVRAFQRIKSFLRPRLVRKRKLPRYGLCHLASDHFEACFKRSHELQLLRTERHLFLGPLPHVLACLDGLRMHFEVEKDCLSKKLQNAAHIDLDDAGANVMQAHARLAKTLELQQLLSPRSSLYLRTGWPASFRLHVEQVGSLVKEAKLEELVRQDLMAEWDLVHKAVLYTGRKTWIR